MLLMDYLYTLVNQINNYDGSPKAADSLRNMICYVSDNEAYRKDELYRIALFEAAQKMRMFGYIKGSNYISVDEVSTYDVQDIKIHSIHNFYASKVYNNNLLDKKQKEIVDTFMSLADKRLIVSAPTSFGKTFLLREIIFLNRHRYNNLLLIFPTIALLNENTENMKKFIDDMDLDYNIVNNVYSTVDVTTKNIYILTPERTLKLLSDHAELNIDFFFFDEVYKIDEDFSKDEDSSKGESIKENDTGRAKVFRIALYYLSKSVKEYYIAGPYLNLDSVKAGFSKYLSKNNITVKQVEFEPTIRIEYDAWDKKSKMHHPLLGAEDVDLYEKGKLSTITKINAIASYLERNKLGQAIFYCSNPANSMKYAYSIIESLPENKKVIEKYRNFIIHLKRRYGVKYLHNGMMRNSSENWSLVKILVSGYGVHHGKFPKYIQKEILKMFNEGTIDYLFCTSTIIEGVNTNAKNVVIINSSIGNNPLTPFALKNIKGRAGRYYHHFIGRVFYTDKKQREIEKQEAMKLNFSTYDEIALLKVDVDNTDLEDLSNTNQVIKISREESFDRHKLPDDVFIKNRLYPRDVQEKYLNYLLQNVNFLNFIVLIGKTNSIQLFLNNRMMNKILDSMADVGVIDVHIKNLYHAVVSKYSIDRFKGLMEYQLKKGVKSPDDDIDKIYLNVFGQIKTIIEYEVPKLLCLFEALYQRAAILRGYNADSFDLSAIIRFFELGVTTQMGIYLVEYGYPIDAIRQIEERFNTLTAMELEESKVYLKQNISRARSFLDNYEVQLLLSALGL